MEEETIDISTSKIKTWKSILTLIVFVITNCIVLFPFHIPIYITKRWADSIHDFMVRLRIISSRKGREKHEKRRVDDNGQPRRLVAYRFPMNFITAPIIADLFLLAVGAIGKREVKEGTIGSDNIKPYDIMIFFITLAYIAISIDASGLIRYLAFKVLQWGGRVGHRLFFYLYVLWAVLSAGVGNDPVILSGTAFLAYMTRVSSNIVHPRAWIHSQFALANIGSAILVTSNPTNLVLAGAFQIKFIEYTAYMIVPVALTVIVLFPFLLYIVFQSEALIPQSIKMHDLSEEARSKKPVNPNIPNARGAAEAAEASEAANDNDQTKLLSLEEIMNPFLDKGGAAFGGIVMAATLATVLGLNAATKDEENHFVFYVTLPAAVVMFCWDMAFGWINRHDTREIAAKGRRELEEAERENARRRADETNTDARASGALLVRHPTDKEVVELSTLGADGKSRDEAPLPPPTFVISQDDNIPNSGAREDSLSRQTEKDDAGAPEQSDQPPTPGTVQKSADTGEASNDSAEQRSEKDEAATGDEERNKAPASLASLFHDTQRWAQETFPTPVAVLMYLPFALVPFAFAMFVLVQALVTKGWVPVFAYGWDHWVETTGTVGAIGGMGFLSVILCNFAGTNIGTTILLSRVIQAWVEIHRSGKNDSNITERDFWATVYSMAIGVNYGAFSIAFSASLAGLLWRDILERKHITIRPLDFARVNLPIIAISMTVGCVVLIGEVYIMFNKDTAYVQPAK